MIKPLLCWMLLLVCGATACDGASQDRRASRGDNYVSDPDHWFFMNTRSRDYVVSSPSEGIDVFQHDDMDGEPRFEIRNDWLQDRADLLIDGQVVLPEQVRQLRNVLGSRRDSFEFTTPAEREAAAEVLADYLRLVGG